MIVQFLCTTYCQIIKNNNYINGFIRDPIRHIVINTKNNIDKKFINIIIQSFCILFFENILIKKTFTLCQKLIKIHYIKILHRRIGLKSAIAKWADMRFH